MKKIYILTIVIIFIISFFLINKSNKKLIIHYTSSSNYIQIEVFNQSEQDIVFPFATDFLIYRKKYNDTLHLSSFKNGKRPKFISHNPDEKKKNIFYLDKITNLNNKKEDKVILTHKILDSFLLGSYNLKNFPVFHIMKPNNTLLIKYRNKYPLEKGKYKIFINLKDCEKMKKYLSSESKEYKFIENNEINDNPLEFEVK